MHRSFSVRLAGCVILATCLVCRADEPKVIREPIEWLDVWVPNSTATDLPRVLLIGDSITRAYYPEVEAKLKGKAYVARLATSKSVGDPALLAEVSLVLSEDHFDVIHFNNGMHGWGYTEDDYRQHFPEFVAAIKNGAKGAKLVWATTTPVRVKDHPDQLSDRTERVKVRNQIGRELVEKEKIPIDDLFALVENHPEYWKKDGVHFEQPGVAAEAEQVAKAVEEVLGKP